MEKIAPQLHRIKELLEENPFTDERDSSDDEEPDLHTQEPVALKREKVRRLFSRSGSVRVGAAWSQLPLPCGLGCVAAVRPTRLQNLRPWCRRPRQRSRRDSQTWMRWSTTVGAHVSTPYPFTRFYL